MNNCLFSVSIVHYKQPLYWRDAIDSVLEQDYPNIQLIFTDDASPNFDENEVAKYIEAKAQSNLFSYKVITHSKNLGTTANHNDGDALCTGQYITHFAADDALHSPQTLSCFAEALEQTPPDTLGVFGKFFPCNQKLQRDKTRDKWLPSFSECTELGSLSSEQLYRRLVLSRGCRIPMGASAFIRDRYAEYCPLDKRMNLIEDWPFFLKISRSGYRMKFVGKETLDHRDGGISTSLKSTPLKKLYHSDMVKVYEFEIMPYLENYFSLDEQAQIIADFLTIPRDEESRESILVPILDRLASNAPLSLLVNKKMAHAYQELNDWTQELQVGKDWLEQQYKTHTSLLEKINKQNENASLGRKLRKLFLQ